MEFFTKLQDKVEDLPTWAKIALFVAGAGLIIFVVATGNQEALTANLNS